MPAPDPRWVQRLDNYDRALRQLTAGVNLCAQRELSDIEQQGLIQAFEFCHELAWNVMRDYFRHQGNSAITGSRDAAREAFSVGLIERGEVWMEMIQSRNLSTHTYNKQVADEIVERIVGSYHEQLTGFASRMRTLAASA